MGGLIIRRILILCLRFGGLIFRRAYFQRSLLWKFYGIILSKYYFQFLICVYILNQLNANSVNVYIDAQSGYFCCTLRPAKAYGCIALFRAAAMLSPRRTKAFVFARLNSFSSFSL